MSPVRAQSASASADAVLVLAARLLATDLTAEQRALAQELREAASALGPGSGTTAAAQQPGQGTAASTRRGRDRARILVVDDSESNRALALLHLDRLGFEAVGARDGWTALDRLASEPFDLVLLDGMMPGLDGPATAREIRRREADAGTAPLPIVALTASILPEDRAILLEAGMDDHLAKPIRIEELARVLEQQLAGVGTRRGVVIPAPATAAHVSRTDVASNPVVDPAVFGRLADLGDPRLTQRLVRLFLADAAERVRQVDSALAVGDDQRLRIALEALEGTCCGVGAGALLRRARELHSGALGAGAAWAAGRPPRSGLGELLDETRSWFDRALETTGSL